MQITIYQTNEKSPKVDPPNSSQGEKFRFLFREQPFKNAPYHTVSVLGTREHAEDLYEQLGELLDR